MAAPKELWKTTIVIWSEGDPQDLEIDELARDAISGDSYCSEQKTELITDKTQFPQTEFFDDGEPEEEDKSTD